jgi:hypothetical protein
MSMMYRICFTITSGMFDALLYTLFFTVVFDCHMRTHACASKRSTNQEEFNVWQSPGISAWFFLPFCSRRKPNPVNKSQAAGDELIAGVCRPLWRKHRISFN